MLGAFHQRTVGGRTVALRDLSEAHEAGKGLDLGGEDAIRDFARFSDWVADRAAGVRSPGATSWARLQQLGKAAASQMPEKFAF